MHIFEVSGFPNPETDSTQDFRFDKSLQELRDLRSQLHYAADYCEKTFLNSKEKNLAVENTKEYICQAVVTLVDHLGNVSANLDHCISCTDTFSEAEIRINSLKQRLFLCEQYAHKLALTRFKWGSASPRYNRRYLSASITNVLISSEGSRDSKFPSTDKITDNNHEIETGDVPLFMYAYTDKLKSSSVKNSPLKGADPVEKCDLNSHSALVPVCDGITTLTKNNTSSTFNFQLSTEKIRRRSLYRRSLQSSDVMSIIRRIKRTA